MSEVASNASFPRIAVHHSVYDRVTAPGRTLNSRWALTHRSGAPAELGAMRDDGTGKDTRQGGLQLLLTPYVYDPYGYCMKLRRERQVKYEEAAPQLDASRRTREEVVLSSTDDPGIWAGSPSSPGAGAADNGSGDATAALFSSCHCSLNLHHLFEDVDRDLPRPASLLSKCELHEILRALPPRYQNRPWKLCYDTSRDGSSLRSFYRAMECVYARGDCGIGLFFVSPRRRDDDDGDDGASASSRRKAAGKPISIVGCFTPEVPCLESHQGPSHAFYGSPDTFVFRVRMAGKRLRFRGLTPSHAPTHADPVPPTAQRGTRQSLPDLLSDSLSQRQSRECSYVKEGRLAEGEAARGEAPEPRPVALNPGFLEHSTSLHNVPALHQIFDDRDDTNLILPMATRQARRAAAIPSPLLGGPVSADLVGPSITTPTTTVASSSQQSSPRFMHSPVARGFPLAWPPPLPPPPMDEQRPPSPPPLVAPVSPASQEPSHVPLLEKYGWCGNTNKRQFVLAQGSFFAIGGGKDGAALLVDSNMQYGTSSVHCETFDSPPLFGGQPPNGLRHTEAEIVRMVWFSLRGDQDARAPGVVGASNKSFRVMTYSETEELALAERAGKTREEVRRCGCGRRSNEYENAMRDRALPAEASSVSSHPPRMPTHRCNEDFFAF